VGGTERWRKPPRCRPACPGSIQRRLGTAPRWPSRTDWIHELSDSDRRELRSAIAVAQASGRPLHELAREQFPLGGLAARLNRLRHEALDGRGFFLLRGVPVAEYSPNLVKKSIVGAGHGDKTQVRMMIGVLLPKADPESHDAADALAIAVTHAHHRRSVVIKVAAAKAAAR
jgi:hypothetical protein